MALVKFDHVNVRTSNLADMSAFYDQVLGLPAGYRPPFGFGGAWHYCGDQAVVHLVETEPPEAPKDPQLEHFALQADGMAEFLDRLRRHNVPYRIAIVPEIEIRQVNLHDPDGNHIHIDFGPDEVADLGDFDGHAQ